ncbi:MAG: hypothetical protein Q7R96_02440 [Nanoarchaeota archaeon]|nr:hypothetical protein [Nanoarchaeota archaeon]
MHDLPQRAHILVNTRSATHDHAYQLLDALHTPMIVVAMNRPAANIKTLLERKHKISKDIHFIDTVAKRANAVVSQEQCTYLFGPDLTILGNVIMQQAANIPGKKWLVMDAVSTLRHWYDQATISKFLAALMPRLHMVQTNGIFLNEEKLPALPNTFFDRIIEWK